MGTALRGVEPIRVDVEPGEVKIERAGEVLTMTPATARHVGELLVRAARLAGA